MLEKIVTTDLVKKTGMTVVALFALFVLYKTLTNDLPHLKEAIDRQTDVFQQTQRETNEVLRENTRVLEGLKFLIERRR